jgi:hypothetical protein
VGVYNCVFVCVFKLWAPAPPHSLLPSPPPPLSSSPLSSPLYVISSPTPSTPRFRLSLSSLSSSTPPFSLIHFHSSHLSIPHPSIHPSIPLLSSPQFLDKLDLVRRTAESARLYGIDFFSVLTRGSQYRVRSHTHHTVQLQRMQLHSFCSPHYLRKSIYRITLSHRSFPLSLSLPLSLTSSSGRSFYAVPSAHERFPSCLTVQEEGSQSSADASDTAGHGAAGAVRCSTFPVSVTVSVTCIHLYY